MSPWLYPILFTAWLGAIGWELHAIGRAAARLAVSVERMEADARFLNERSREIASLVRETRALSDEVGFLQELPNLLPQDKGYLRTQKAITDDVSRLRAQVGRRLAGALHVVIDARANKLYLKKGLTLLWQADCSVGRGGTLKDAKTGRIWEFATPRGELQVWGKREKPFWIKPDWAFVEAGLPIPPPEDPSRRVEGELGAYLLNLGDGYLIHGTKDESSLGRAVSHGCVRLGAQDLEKLYQAVPVGTKVYILY